MEKLAYYWKRLRQNRLAYNLVLIGAIILAMAVACATPNFFVILYSLPSLLVLTE